MADLNEREAAQGMETVIETSPHLTEKGKAWWRMVTIENNGARHVLTQWQKGTPADARKAAKRERLRLIEVES